MKKSYNAARHGSFGLYGTFALAPGRQCQDRYANFFSTLKNIFCAFLAENIFVKVLIPLRGGTENRATNLRRDSP